MTKKTNTEARSIKIIEFVLGYMVRTIWALALGILLMLLTRILHYQVIFEVAPIGYASSVVIMFIVIFICEGISKAINFDPNDYKE